MQSIKKININNNLTKVAVNICIATVLCGQFGFRVAAYYVDGIRPSLPFWAFLYLFSLAVLYLHRSKLSLIYYLAHIFFVYITLYCIIYNNGNYEFFKNFIIYCIIPYACGILIGRYLSDLLYKVILIYSFTYITLILWMYETIPYAFQADRLYIFAPKNWDRNGGDPTGIYLGMNFGCTFIILSCYYLFCKDFLKSTICYIFITIIIFVLFSYGSRSAILGSYIAVLFIIISQIYYEKRNSVIKLLLILLASFFTIFYATPERMNFIKQLSSYINYFKVIDNKKEIVDSNVKNLQLIESHENAHESKMVTKNLSEFPAEKCLTIGDSIGTRLLMHKEALMLFSTYPIVGVGPGGFGRSSCADGNSFASPHFLLLQILVDFGLIGGLLFIFNFIFLPGFMLYRRKSLKHILKNYDIRLIIALWIFFMLYEQFSGNIYYAYHFFLISGILISKIYKYHEKQI